MGKRKKAEVLTVGTNSKDQTFFIMGNKGMVPGTHYFTTYKKCMIAIFVMCKYDKLYTNIYDMNQNQYESEILGK